MNLKKILISGITAMMLAVTFSIGSAVKAKNYIPDNKNPENEPKQEFRRPNEGMQFHGTITRVEDNCIYVRLNNNNEIKVNLTSQTKYHAFRSPAEKKDLVAGKFVGINVSDPEEITKETKEITALDIAIKPPVIKGTVSSAQGSEITIKLDDGSSKKLVVDKDTKIFLNYNETFQGKITQGMRLSALVDSIGDVMQAKIIKIHQK